MDAKYFTPAEFDSPDAPGSGARMKPSFISRLDSARAVAGVPFVITSGYRTPQHNEQVGGIPDSAHTRGRAADISLQELRPEQQLAVITALHEAGFRRLGWSPGSFVHVDDDPSKPSPALWDYSDAAHKA